VLLPGFYRGVTHGHLSAIEICCVRASLIQSMGAAYEAALHALSSVKRPAFATSTNEQIPRWFS
jgi:hypothetical protein